MSTWTQERARVASLSRSRPPDDPDLVAARRNLRAAHLAEYVRKAVEQAPPLTAEQRARVAAALGLVPGVSDVDPGTEETVAALGERP